MTHILGQTLLNRFRVDAYIASGGMGAVFRVWDLKRSTPLAMKLLHAELAEDPSVMKLFKREARALERLKHPHIVPFYGLHETDDFVFLLEAFIDGPTLNDILRKEGGALPLDQVLIYLKALSAALGYAHANGVVHCDVKPGNVMIDRGGGIYLTDFGIARHAESTVTTLAGAGSPAYMAPEQIRGEPVTPATDVYALGVVLYEMLTGKRPFTGSEPEAARAGQTTAERMRYAQQHLPAPDPRTINPTIPPAWANVALQALKKDPNRRFGDAPALFAAACQAARVSPDQVRDRVNLPHDGAGHAGDGLQRPPRRPWEWARVIGIGLATLALVAWAVQTVLPRQRTMQQATPVVTAHAAVEDATTGPPAATAPPGVVTAAPAIPPATLPPPATEPPTPAAPPSTATAEPAMPTLTLPPPATEPPTPAPTPVPNWQQGRLVMVVSGSDHKQRDLFIVDLTYLGPLAPFGLDPSYYSGPVWSRDGETIAFYNSYDKSLWITAPPPNVSPRRLADCTQPTWSPDSALVMCRYGDGQTSFYNVASGESFAGPLFEYGNLFDWSPVEDLLAYSVFGADRSTSIHVADTYGRDDRVISGSSFENYAPAWSHDGQWIAYQSDEGSDFSEIWIMDANGNSRRQITDSQPGYFARGPTWSPDDRWIAFVYGLGGADWGEVYIVSVNGGEPFQVTDTGSKVYDWRVHWGN